MTGRQSETTRVDDGDIVVLYYVTRFEIITSLQDTYPSYTRSSLHGFDPFSMFSRSPPSVVFNESIICKLPTASIMSITSKLFKLLLWYLHSHTYFENSLSHYQVIYINKVGVFTNLASVFVNIQ